MDSKTQDEFAKSRDVIAEVEIGVEGAVPRLLATVRQQAAEIARLQNYTQHGRFCVWNIAPDQGCDCGLYQDSQPQETTP